MTSRPRARSVLRSAVAALVVALSACTSSAQTSAGPPSSGPASVAGSSSTVRPPSAAASSAPFGPGCAALRSPGGGNLEAAAGERVTVAAAHDLALGSLVVALARAQLADSVDSQQDVTVLAPANAAFAAVPRSSLTPLLSDTARLTRLLTHHVLEGRLTPGQFAGTHTTLANDTVTITGAGETFAISSGQTLLRSKPAAVVCGNIRTANATVYIVDQVLAPQG